jgi:LmbE family N-acetylglucosaminyl deacetylase
MHTAFKELLQDRGPLFLHSISFPKTLRILVLAPHPDDFDGIGITMRFFRDNGHEIHVAVISSGADGVEDDFCDPPTREAKGAIREEEQRASCRFFGLPESNLAFLRLREDSTGHPMENRENLQRLGQIFLEKKPALVFLPHGNDQNLGHQRTYSMFRRIASEVGYPMTAFLNRDPKTIGMRNDLYTVYDAQDAEWKGQLLRFHESQHQRNLHTRNCGFDERILGIDRQTAREMLGTENYAEVFEIEFLRQG